ncbi:MAG: hypothetical protein PHD45_06410 [Bacteroidales bacterium]|nr:hypothetical protein [Bacteroidales bacterium]
MEILITIIIFPSILTIFLLKGSKGFIYCYILPFLTKIKFSEKHKLDPDLDVLRSMYLRLLLRERHFLQRWVTGKSTCACNQINNEHCMCRKAQRLWKDKVCKVLC